MIDLDAEGVEAALARLGSRVGRPLSIVAETRSTNDDARAATAGGAPHGAAFLADAQTAGRGRGGRSWHSPPGENLYLSVVLRPAIAAAMIPPLALVIGIAVARVIDRAAGAGARIKWPNDVLVSGKKIAGVLVEGQLRGALVASLVAGVGINVHATSFPDEIAQRATSLALAGGRALCRSELAASLLVEIDEVVQAYEAGGLVAFLDELAARDALVGARVRAGEVSGVAAGIDAQGRLLVRDDAGRVRSIAAGEVRLEHEAQQALARGDA